MAAKNGFLFLIIAFFAIVLFYYRTNPHSPAGFEGYVYEAPRIFGKGGYKATVLGPSNYGLSFFNNQVINIDIRPDTYTEEFRILAKDDLNVSFNFHAVLKVQTGKAKSVVEQYGAEEWYNNFVKEPFKGSVRFEVQKYKSTEIKANRAEIESKVMITLSESLENTPFELIDVAVGNIDYPEIVTKAVEQKLAAIQLLEEKETQRKITEQDAEIRIIDAKGIAESQQIINKTLTENYLQFEAIEAQKLMANSPNHTTVYIPVGTNGLPLVFNQDNSRQTKN